MPKALNFSQFLNGFILKVKQRKEWTLSPSAFSNFLAWLDEGANSEGQKYLEIRQRLVNFFDRKNCLRPNQLADETLNRVARRLEEEGTIESETPAKYCYIVAKFVFLEYLRSDSKESVSIDEVQLKSNNNSDEKELKEKQLNCLETCTGKLEPENRQMIFQYYYGEERVKIENRRALAQGLGISVNALSIRACRIREKLEGCVKKCVEKD